MDPLRKQLSIRVFMASGHRTVLFPAIIRYLLEVETLICEGSSVVGAHLNKEDQLDNGA